MMKRQIHFIFFFLVLISLGQKAVAVSAYPYPVEVSQPDGSKITIILKGDEWVKWAQTVDGYSIMRNNKGSYEYAILDANSDMIPSGQLVRNLSERSGSEKQFLTNVRKKSFPTTGSRKLICILMGFSDKPFSKTQSEYNNLFNQVGYNTDGATGSVYDFYKENSYGQLDLTVTVVGPFVASHPMAYYGANINDNDSDPRALVTEAVNQANSNVNYADFDNDGDGEVDGVYVIYAGYGEEAGGGENAIWAHAWGLYPSLTLDGKEVSRYSCSAELRGNSGSGMTRIGVICHEFGHVMGAPDFYDTDYGYSGGQFDGTGDWDIMAGGSWNNNGATPAHHNPYTKSYVYNWANIATLSEGVNIKLTNAEQSNTSFYRINTSTINEFFLIENRQQHLFDSYIPGHGMIIYHVDDNYINSAGNGINTGNHQGMYPVCAIAAGNPPLTYGVINNEGLPFPGTSKNTSFTDATTPNSLSWGSENTGKPITNITENSTTKTVTFSFMGGLVCTPPSVQASSLSFNSITNNSMTVTWDRGNGTNVLLVVKEGGSIDVDPLSGLTYRASSTFSDGEQIGSNVYTLYKGIGTSVNVNGLEHGKTYYYSVYEYSNALNCYFAPALTGNASTTTTDVGEIETDKINLLAQNYPNPFDQATTFDFKILKPSRVTLKVYNSIGQVIDVIVDESLSEGNYSRQWIPKGIASGIYFYQLSVNGLVETKRLVKE